MQAMSDQMDYAALGFTLTPDEAARVMDTTPGQIRDLIRTNQIGFVVLPRRTSMPSFDVRIHPTEAADYLRRERRGQISSDHRLRSHVVEVIRRYLAEIPAVEFYDEAVEKFAPLLCSTRDGEVLHISPGSVAEFTKRVGGTNDIPLTTSAIERALESLRAVRKRGVIPAGDKGGKQRWGTWWRIPYSLMPGQGDAAMVDDMINGVMEPDERLTRHNTRGYSNSYLTGTLGADDQW